MSRLRVSPGFALPAVLITSSLMLAVLVTAAQAVAVTRGALTSQYWERQARLAAESGLVMAQACLEANDFEVTWTDALPLVPGGDCAGGGSGYVSASDQMRASFRVPAPNSEDASYLRVGSTGTIERLRTSDPSQVFETHQALDSMVIERAATTQVASGSHMACALVSNRAYCWGRNTNNDGRLGLPGVDITLVPMEVQLPARHISSIQAGGGHTCAVVDGDAYCWGRNTFGQVGQPASDDGFQTPQKVDHSVLNTSSVLTMYLGWEYTCALLDNGRIYCWGRNHQGQLGDGTQTHSHTPRQVQGLTNATHLPSGGNANHMCAIAGGDAYCWGGNSRGQVGQPSSTARFTTPQQVDLGGRAVTDITTGQTGGDHPGMHTCVVANHRVWCWGGRSYGQLGDGQTEGTAAPQIVNQGELGSREVSAVTASDRHTCAMTRSPVSLYCWGGNGHGQLGLGFFSQREPVPREVVQTTSEGWSASRLKTIVGGGYRTCAISGIRTYCWGAGGLGQLGDGRGTTSHTPINSRAINDLMRPVVF